MGEGRRPLGFQILSLNIWITLVENHLHQANFQLQPCRRIVASFLRIPAAAPAFNLDQPDKSGQLFRPNSVITCFFLHPQSFKNRTHLKSPTFLQSNSRRIFLGAPRLSVAPPQPHRQTPHSPDWCNRSLAHKRVDPDLSAPMSVLAS